MEENVEEFKKYNAPVTISVNGLDIHWHPLSESLTGFSSLDAEEIANTVNEFIRALRAVSPNGTIAATPEGPFLKASIKDIYTVIWAVNTIYGDAEITVKGDAPTMADMGLDENSNYDKDGNIVIR